jgi:hypothetical protein
MTDPPDGRTGCKDCVLLDGLAENVPASKRLLVRGLCLLKGIKGILNPSSSVNEAKVLICWGFA